MSTPTVDETAVATIPDDDVLTTDETVQTTDETVQTTDETVQTIDEAIDPGGVVTLDMAAQALHDDLGALVDAEYLLGKTRFRDVLCARFDLSQATAEELVDALEESALIRFVDSKEEGSGWHVHLEGDAQEELPRIGGYEVDLDRRRAA